MKFQTYTALTCNVSAGHASSLACTRPILALPMLERVWGYGFIIQAQTATLPCVHGDDHNCHGGRRSLHFHTVWLAMLTLCGLLALKRVCRHGFITEAWTAVFDCVSCMANSKQHFALPCSVLACHAHALWPACASTGLRAWHRHTTGRKPLRQKTYNVS